MNWELADRVKGMLKPGQRVYAYSRVKGKRKKVDSYSVTRDMALVSAEFEGFLQELEPHEVEVRDSNGYVTSCRLSCKREDDDDDGGSWTEDIDPQVVAQVMAAIDDPDLTPRQIVGQLLSVLSQKPPQAQ